MSSCASEPIQIYINEKKITDLIYLFKGKEKEQEENIKNDEDKNMHREAQMCIWSDGCSFQNEYYMIARKLLRITAWNLYGL